MAHLTVRHVEDRIVKALERRAAAHGRSSEAEHRAILSEVLAESGSAESFAERAAQLRRRLRSGMDSTEFTRSE